MGIVINVQPIEVVIDGTTILMQGDPSATPAWDTLMDLSVPLNDPKKRQAAHDTLVEALAGLAETADDSELIRKLDIGTATLKHLAEQYAKAVTGFPTQPPPTSKKR